MMTDRQKIFIRIKPSGETFSEWVYHNLKGVRQLNHQLPGYTYDYPQLLGVPVVILASIGRKLDTEVFECLLITDGIERKLQYNRCKKFGAYDDLIIEKQFPAYWDTGTVVIRTIIKNKVARDGLFFEFGKAIGNGEAYPRYIELTIEAHFAALTRFSHVTYTSHNTFNGGLMGKKFAYEKKSNKDIHTVNFPNLVLLPSEEIDVVIIASRLPLLPNIGRSLFWAIIFLIVFASVIMNFIYFIHNFINTFSSANDGFY